MLFDVGAFPVEVDIFLGAFDGPRWQVEPFRHRSGWLMVSEARLVTAFYTHSRFLVAAVSDHGEIYAPTVAARIFDMPASLPRDAECDPPEVLEEAMDALYWDFLGAVDQENLRLLEEAEGRLETRIHALEDECATLEMKIWKRIRALRAERRHDGLDEARSAEIDAQLERLFAMPDEIAQRLRQHTADMRRETEALEEAVLSSLADHGEIDRCYVIRWRARLSSFPNRDICLPMAGGEKFGVARGQAGVERRTLEQIAEMRVFRDDWNSE